MFFVYILRCHDGSLYTGYTDDLHKRMHAHQNGKGAKYVRARLPFTLAYSESFTTKREACKREYEIKQQNKKWKELLIKSKE